MKNLLSLLSSITLFTTGATATVLSTTNTNLPTNTNTIPTSQEASPELTLKANDTKTVTLAENYMFGWQVSASFSGSWIDWAEGYWHLEFNHKLAQDIVNTADDALATVDWLKDQFKEIAAEYPSLSSIVESGAGIINKIISWSKDEFQTNDKGNGIDIEFYAWVIPWSVSASNHNW